MTVGDRISHKKFGLGEVKAIYPKNQTARVLYDSGHESTNSIKNLRPMARGSGQTVLAEPSVKKTRRKGASSGNVDYAKLERAKKFAETEFPDAEYCVPQIYGDVVYVEVWEKGAAQIAVFHEDDSKRKNQNAN